MVSRNDFNTNTAIVLEILAGLLALASSDQPTNNDVGR